MIKTERLYLIACKLKHFDAFERNEKELAEILNVEFADDWLIFRQWQLKQKI